MNACINCDSKKDEINYQQWRTIRKNICIKDGIILLLLIVIISIGIIADIGINNGWFTVLYYVNDISSLTMNLIQIEAAVISIVISIIALMSGTNKESYMGVSICRFCMEIRPISFKQHNVIIFSFLVVATSVFAYVNHAYNIVISMWLCTLIISLKSALGVYSLFGRFSEIRKEIEGYYAFTQYSDIRKAESLYVPFAEEWKVKISLQSEEEYERFAKVWEAWIDVVYQTNSVEEIKHWEAANQELVVSMLRNMDNLGRCRGVNLVQRYYSKFIRFSEIKRDNGLPQIDTSLLSYIVYDLYDALNTIPSEIVYKYFDFNVFTSSVIWTLCMSNEKNAVIEITSLHRFQAMIGKYLENQSRLGLLDNYVKKHCIGEHLFLFQDEVPNNMKNFFLKSHYESYFNVCYGLLMHGFTDIVKKYYINKFGRSISEHSSKEEFIEFFMVHAYMYYLAYRESDDCISQRVKESVKELISDTDVKNVFSEVMYYLSENSEMLSPEVEKTISDYLSYFERLPEDDAKICIMESVINDYYLFVAAYINQYGWAKSNLTSMVSHEWGRYLIKNQNLYTCFEEILALTNNEISATSEVLVDTIKLAIAQKYKETHIEMAIQEQESYEKEGKKIKSIIKIGREVKSGLKAKFDSIIDESISNNEIQKVRLCTIDSFTQFIAKVDITQYLKLSSKGIINHIISVLEREKKIHTVIRKNDYPEDKAFYDFLKKEKVDCILASKNMFNPFDYNNSSMYDDFFKNITVFSCNSCSGGVAIRKQDIKLKIKKIYVKISDMSFDDVEKKKNPDGTYNIEPSIGIPVDFSEEELREYIHNERKKVEIYGEIAVVYSGKTGILVKRK